MNYHSCLFAVPLRRARPKGSRRGAMLVLIAISLMAMIVISAFAVELARMQLVRTELCTATDSAARAGAMTLSLQQDVDAGREAAREAASRNFVAGAPLQLADEDILIGESTQVGTGRFNFMEGGTLPNAVRVEGRRTAGSLSGPVRLLFPGVLRVETFEPIHNATSAQLDRDICLVIDRSGSMAQGIHGNSVPGGLTECDPPHPTESRWAAMVTAINGFIEELGNTRQQEFLGLASYSSDNSKCGYDYVIAETNCPLSSNHNDVVFEVQQIGSAPINGRTAISAGIDQGVLVLTGAGTRPFAVKTMVLLTDGLHNEGREPLLAAQDAAVHRITIHTVTFSDDADIPRMQQVAAATGGQHFHAPDAEELERIFREIARTLPVMLVE